MAHFHSSTECSMGMTVENNNSFTFIKMYDNEKKTLKQDYKNCIKFKLGQ